MCDNNFLAFIPDILFRKIFNYIRITFIYTYDKVLLITNILGLKYDLPVLTDNQKILYNEWLNSRENKDFVEADRIRDILINEGVL